MEPVNVLLLGGLTHLSRPLLHHLLQLSDGPQIKKIRIVDKHLVEGEASTIYMDPESLEALKDSRVEYRQANLNIPETASAAFDLPENKSFDFVFDLTGEGILGSDVPSQLLLERTTKLAGTLAAEAQRRKVKAYVRDTPPFWTGKPDEGPFTESDVNSRSKPKGVRAYFYYEAERAAANVDELPLILLRSAAIYGPQQYHGSIGPRIALGEVYRMLKEPMKMLWSSDLKIHTLHSRDWCRAAWSAALWCGQRTRIEANGLAGEELPRIAPKDKGKFSDIQVDEEVERCCPHSKTPRAPVFNVVDAGDTNQGKLLQIVGQVYGIETGFTNAAINTWAKLNLASVVEDMNEKHAEAINTLAAQSNPPIVNCPISCFLYPDDVGQRATALNGCKIERVIGWRPQEQPSVETVKEVIESFKKAGKWVCQ